MTIARIVTSTRFARVVVPGLAAVWTLHVVLTELGDPLGGAFDQGLWIAACLLKCGALAALAGLSARVYRVVAGSARRSWIAFGVWWTLLTALVVLLALAREGWAGVVSTDAVTYYARLVPLASAVEADRTAWQRAWESGAVVGAEVALVTLLAVLHAIVGRVLGHRPWEAVIVGYGCSGLALLAYLRVVPWTTWSYDLFHGDVLAGALLADPLLFFMANDPYTSIACIAYVALLAAALTILRLTRGSATWAA